MASDIRADSLTLGELGELVEWGRNDDNEAASPRLKSLIVHDIIDAFDYNAVLDHITLVLLPASITYVGKKAVDVFMKLEESAALKKFESRDEPDRRIIVLYDRNGAVVARIEVPLDT
jgi:hypothetical protein